MDCDPGAPGLGALVRLQELDQGQLWAERQVVRPQDVPQECAWWGGRKVGTASLTT